MMTAHRCDMLWGMAAALALLAWPMSVSLAAEPGTPAFFEEKVRPIITEHCLSCHGPDEARSGLALHDRLSAFGETESGEPAIVHGDADASELIRRVTSDDPDIRMPVDADPLSDEQVEILKQWIDSGAGWAEHWAYRGLERPEPPPVQQHADRVRNPIDRFVLARLERESVQPSPEADRYTLIRRLYYDLLGLPPTPEEVDAFVEDESPDAYERLVDLLLASPHFGERWGRHWLDKARYADSDGYEKDNPRPNAYRYRDWVIDAINRDMPFDQFTIEQLAGDLLPNAGDDQHLATAFHRQTLTNTEGGTDQEEFRVEAVVDRTNTTAGIWLGLTAGCAQCHNHKYDQLTQAEYFGLYAFFNSWDETTRPIPRSAEAMREYEAAAAAHDRKLEEARAAYQAHRDQLSEGLEAWTSDIREKLASGEKASPAPLTAVSLESRNGATLETLDDNSVRAGGDNPPKDTYTIIAKVDASRLAGLQLEAMADESLGAGGPGRTAHGNFVLSELRMWVADSREAVAGEGAQRVDLHNASASHAQDGWPVEAAIDGDESTGWAIMPHAGQTHTARFALVEPRTIEGGRIFVRIELSQQYGSQHTLGRFRLTALPSDGELLPTDVADALASPADARTPEHQAALLDYRVSQDETGRTLRDRVDELEQQAPQPPLMDVRVLTAREQPRQTHILERGDFQRPGEPVSRHTPAVLHELKPRDPEAGPDRLDFARWLMDERNPLTPRVLANDVWTKLFGQGLVATVNDFGVRGERPSHADLLDWLATEYRRLGWSRKRMIRTIVTSSTYRQQAEHRSDMVDIDPLNRLLYRQNRFRVEGEIVRDLTLAASGLLSDKIGGPSVFPPMPPEIAALSYANNFQWATSEGEDRYRRGMYTFFKRTAPYPELMTFDCPDSNTSTLQRRTSNTPLQALTLLNNEVYVEAAQAMARRVLREAKGDAARLSRAMRLCIARPATDEEIAQLADLLETSRQHYASADPEHARQLAGDAPLPEGVDAREAAAWVATLRIVLNLDEFITRP